MATDTPTLYLGKVVTLLTTTRWLGAAAQMRDGYTAYSTELDFRTTDEVAARRTIARAAEKAPYADYELVPTSTATGTITIFTRVDPLRLARYLVEQASSQGGEALAAVSTTAQRVVDETVGTGASWARLLARLHTQQALLETVLDAMEDGTLAGPAAAVVQDAVQQAALGDRRQRLIASLRARVQAFNSVALALEAGSA